MQCGRASALSESCAWHATEVSLQRYADTTMKKLRHQGDRREEMLHCTQEMMGSRGSCWPNDGDVNGIRCAFSVGHQKCPQLYSCKFQPW